LKMLRDFPDGLGQARTVDDGKLVLSVWSQPTFAVKEIILRQVGRMRSRSSLGGCGRETIGWYANYCG